MNATKRPAIDLSGLGKLSEMHGGAAKEGAVLDLLIEKVGEDENVRKTNDPDKLAELAATIKEHGVLQPITVKPANAAGIHVILWGHRRFRASKLAGLKTIRAIVEIADKNDRADTIVRQVIENEQRANLTAAEMADAVADLLAEKLSQKQIAEKLGKPKSIISLYAGYADFAEPVKALPLPIRTLYELDRAHGLDAPATLAFLQSFADAKEITRREAATFAASLREPAPVAPKPTTLPGIEPTSPTPAPAPSVSPDPESLSGQTPTPPSPVLSPAPPSVGKPPSPPVDTAPSLTPKAQGGAVMDVILKGVLMQCLEELEALGAGEGPAASRVRQLLKVSATGPES